MKPASKAELKAVLVKRRPEDHKGTFGHVLIVGGSRGMLGAPVLAARAALRSGAGLVTLAVPAGLQAQAAPLVLEALTLGLPENSAGSFKLEAVAPLKDVCKKRGYTVMAIGPGLSEHRDTAQFALGVLRSLPLPAVVDADALNVLAAQNPASVKRLLRARPACVFTPHPGEMARCLSLTTRQVQKERQRYAQRLASEWGGVVALKGHRTIVAGAARAVVNETGSAALARGGTGDALAGVIAALWAQALASGRAAGDAAFRAAAAGVYVHGLAGEAVEKEKTAFSATASDVVEALPRAFAALSR